MSYELKTQQMDLASAVPRGDLANTGYCLANPGNEYLIYAPNGGEIMADLSAVKGELRVEWYDPTHARSSDAGQVQSGDGRQFTAPFEGPAVLFLIR